jgi:hypothetical protein
MKASTHEITFKGDLLNRGFWLYVWEITTPQNNHVYYVGRTGDSSSINAQSPFNRMGQHLSYNEKQNMLRRHLDNKQVIVEMCDFRLIAYGPILEQATTRESHIKSRDAIAAIEKQLAKSLIDSGYDVLNTVNCKKLADPVLWNKVRQAFAKHFPNIKGV